MVKITIVWWRDIPAQIIAGQNRRSQIRYSLSERFEKAIDRAAMRAKAHESDQYLSEWRKVPEESLNDDFDEAVKNRAQQLETLYDDAHLETLIKNGGYAKKAT
ncbi:MAG: virulence factor [Pseudomonadota bacterium]